MAAATQMGEAPAGTGPSDRPHPPMLILSLSLSTLPDSAGACAGPAASPARYALCSVRHA
eukprot:794746-Rhodomonas_salina.1